VSEELARLRETKFRELAEKLQFTPAEGRIWLEDRRMVLLQAEMLTTLRMELVESLGVRQTRGILTRLGYQTGCRDAALALKFCADGSGQDLLRTGGVLHALQGFVVSETLVAGSIDSREDFYAEWLWKESIEDEAHIASMGIGSDPACWMEIGYSSGYLSTCLGRRILAREVECRAMGNSHCRIIARPADSWEDAAEDLAYLEPDVHPRLPVAAAPLPSEPTPALPATTGSGRSGRALGASAAFNLVLHKIRKVAPTTASVLLLGESGVGKSMFAGEIVQRGPRADKAFVEVNCAAIPEQLLESELFGVVRGAFSGAVNSRAGRFEIANGGTLFLDEIGTLSLTAQSKLLRVLQNGEIERLGSTATLRTDVRVIAATNQDLRQAVKDGSFREDLFYRLNVFPIHVQPLRERRDDIPVLVELFIDRYATRHHRRVHRVSSRGLHAMLLYSWPGNIRELENVIERAVILAEDDGILDVHHLFSGHDSFDASNPWRLGNLGQLVAQTPLQMEASHGVDEVSNLDDWAKYTIEERRATLQDVETSMIHAAMSATNENVSAAAGLLGLTRAQLDYRLKKKSG
jgi:DNA-binding NtrC family response regulator/predicted hydrocarbon binding protein